MLFLPPAKNVDPSKLEATLTLQEVPKGCQGGSVANVLGSKEAKADFSADMLKLLAKAHGVYESDIHITDLRKGSLECDYVVDSLSGSTSVSSAPTHFKEKLSEVLGVNMANFEIVWSLPCIGFNPNDFDEAGNKTNWEGQKFDIGPPGNTRTYHQPEGREWVRYGLKVCGFFESDTWLKPFTKKHGLWYRVFHGCRNPGESALSIYKDGFEPSSKGTYGPGVYCSPLIDLAKQYAFRFEVPTEDGFVLVNVVVQAAVKPGCMEEHGSEWLVKDPNHIRPYGLLIREA